MTATPRILPSVEELLKAGAELEPDAVNLWRIQRTLILALTWWADSDARSDEASRILTKQRGDQLLSSAEIDALLSILNRKAVIPVQLPAIQEAIYLMEKLTPRATKILMDGLDSKDPDIKLKAARYIHEIAHQSGVDIDKGVDNGIDKTQS